MHLLRICLFFLLLNFCPGTTQAQGADAKADDRGALLFLHTDKNIYTNNEDIWFSAYLLNSGGASLSVHQFLVVSLINEAGRKMVLHQKFIMDAGFGNGNIHLPDTIAPGSYQLIAYTNVVDKNNQPLDIFKQRLTIKNIGTETISASMMLADTLPDKNGNYHIELFAQPSIISKKLKPEVSYTMGNAPARPVQQDLLGKYEIMVPVKSITESNATVFATIKYQGNVKYLSVKLPQARPKVTVRFFPEGGNLSSNMLNLVGMEARAGAIPVSVKGVLLQDNLPIDTIRTNYAGLARFRFKHDGKSRYTFKLIGNVAPAYPLPVAVKNDLALSVAKAVCNDTLKFRVMSAGHQKVHILLRDAGQVYFSFYHPLKRNHNDFAIDLQAVPKGAGTLTILDSLERPVAERVFFAHYNRRIVADIKTDKRSYAKREQVNVTLTLKDALTNQPVNALLSVACVQGNRLEAASFRDIESYAYLFHGVDDAMLNPHLADFKTRSTLEDNLLIKGWRRYTWQDTLQPPDTLYNSLLFTGRVLQKGKPFHQSLAIKLIKDSVTDHIQTDTTGQFRLWPDALYSAYGNKPVFYAKALTIEGMDIRFTDPYEEISNAFASSMIPNSSGDGQANTSLGYLSDDLKRTKQLKQVTVKAARDVKIYGSKTIVNRAGDYVCYNGILNCTNHPYGGLPPVEGMMYMVPEKGMRVLKVYQSRSTAAQSVNMIKIDGIYAGKEYYGLVKSDLEGSTSQYVSILHWNPAVNVDETGTYKFAFYNGDITGQFKIIVQGVSAQALVSAVQNYDVGN